MIALYCEVDRLHNDLADMLRLFYGMQEIILNPDSAEGAEHVVCHQAEQQDQVWRHHLTLDQHQLVYCWPVPDQNDSVMRLRQYRRGAKLGLYQLLKTQTGYHPPWGSLTGIRPTHMLRQLQAEYGEEEAIHVMADTFDVSREKVVLLKKTMEAQQGIYLTGDEETIDIYIGIPFCKTRCLYCSFISADLSRGRHDVPGYVDALVREIAHGGELVRRMGKKVRSVYVGGGTPTAIGRTQLDRVLTASERAFGQSREWTVEAGRPDTMDESMLQMIHDHGVHRISINPQTMNGETLKRIGRAHTPEDVIETLNTARKWDWKAINMDLIAGLPGEDRAAVQHTLDIVATLPIDNLTIHTLAVKRSSRLHEFLDRYPLPEASDVEAMVSAGSETAEKMGMVPYYLYRQKFMRGNLENVGYCLPGKACIYNIDIMEETHPILALGAGGSSKRMFYDQNRHERFFNPKGVDYYMANLEDNLARKAAFFLQNSEQ